MHAGKQDKHEIENPRPLINSANLQFSDSAQNSLTYPKLSVNLVTDSVHYDQSGQHWSKLWRYQ